MNPVIQLEILPDGKLQVSWGNDIKGTVSRVFVNNTPMGKHTIDFELGSCDKTLNVSYVPE